jgi:hypothetical protein
VVGLDVIGDGQFRAGEGEFPEHSDPLAGVGGAEVHPEAGVHRIGGGVFDNGTGLWAGASSAR